MLERATGTEPVVPGQLKTITCPRPRSYRLGRTNTLAVPGFVPFATSVAPRPVFCFHPANVNPVAPCHQALDTVGSRKCVFDVQLYGSGTEPVV